MLVVDVHSQFADSQFRSGRPASLKGAYLVVLEELIGGKLHEHLQAWWTWAHGAARSQESHAHQVTMAKGWTLWG